VFHSFAFWQVGFGHELPNPELSDPLGLCLGNTRKASPFRLASQRPLCSAASKSRSFDSQFRPPISSSYSPSFSHSRSYRLNRLAESQSWSYLKLHLRSRPEDLVHRHRLVVQRTDQCLLGSSLQRKHASSIFSRKSVPSLLDPQCQYFLG
jgi:hypothetical protein